MYTSQSVRSLKYSGSIYSSSAQSEKLGALDRILVVLLVLIITSGFSFLMPLRYYMILLFGVLYFFRNWTKSGYYIKITKESIILLVFTMLLGLGFFWSYDSFETLKFFVVYCVSLLLCISPARSGFSNIVIRGIEFAVKIIALSILLNALIPNLFSRYLPFLIRGGATSSGRVDNEVSQGIYSGIMGEKGEAAFMMVVAIIAKLSFFQTKKACWKDYIWLVIYSIALFLPAKRMLFAIGVLILFGYILLWNKGGRRVKFLAGAILCCIIVFIVMLMVPSLSTLIERFINFAADDTANGRTYLWDYAFIMFAESPIFGSGYGAYNSYASELGVIISNYHTWESHAHNFYIQILAEMGVVGFAIFLLLLLVVLYDIMKLYRERKHMSVGDKTCLCFASLVILMIMIYGLTGNSVYYTNQILIFYWSISIIIFLSSKYKKHYGRKI